MKDARLPDLKEPAAPTRWQIDGALIHAERVESMGGNESAPLVILARALREAERRGEELLGEIKRKDEALRPFAKEYEDWDHAGDHKIISSTSLTVGDLYSAHAALAPRESGK